MTDWTKTNFPILLLSGFIVLFTAVTLFVFVYLGASKDAVSWANNAFSGFMGALLGIITGSSMAARRTADKTDVQKTGE
jgi:hypothetical protein